MWNPMVVAELAWEVKDSVSHAAAATSFVCASPPPSTLSKPFRLHYLSYPVAGRWEIERESARSTSPRALQTMMYRSCLLDERGRRRGDPSGLHHSSEHSTAIRLYYAQRHYFSDHPSDPLTSLSGGSRGQECARGCSDGGTMFQYERFPSSCHGFRVRGRQTSRLTGSSSTGDWSSTPGSRKRPPEEEVIRSKFSVLGFRRGRILFAGFVGRMEDTRLPKSVMFGELVGGVGCVGDQENEWTGCLLDGLRAFGFNADLWTAAGQDEGG